MDRIMVYRFGDEQFNGAGDVYTLGNKPTRELINRACFDIPGPGADGFKAPMRLSEVCGLTIKHLTQAAQNWLRMLSDETDEAGERRTPDEASEVHLAPVLWSVDVPAEHVRIGNHQVLVDLGIDAAAYYPPEA